MNKKLLIFGTGEIGELAYFYFKNDTQWDVFGFVCDDEYYIEDKFLGLPCVKFSEISNYFPTNYAVHATISESNSPSCLEASMPPISSHLNQLIPLSEIA